MRRILIAFTFLPLFICRVAPAQVTFQDVPVKNRLYAREANDSGDVVIRGSVNKSGADYQEIRIKAYRNGSALPMAAQKLVFTGNTAAFSLAYRIKAELASYRFQIIGFNGAAETILGGADSVVAGDVFIIQGQSNAESHSFDGTSAKANANPYIRVYGSSNPTIYYTDWNAGQGDNDMYSVANTGQWELRMARQIVDNAKIPVAIFNGNHSGKPIVFFERNDVNPSDTATNYGRLLRRLKATGLTGKVRGIFWVQGENNSTTATADYKSAFISLRQGWLADYPGTERIYLFQLRNGCKNPLPEMARILEAERQLAQELPNVENMSMSAQKHDAGSVCHYPFPGGYELMGNNIYRLVARDYYGVDGDDIEPPAIRFAEASGDREITLFMKNAFDSLSWNEGSQNEFELTGGNAKVTAGSVSGSRVKLALSAAAAGITAISFLGHAEVPPEPLVLNRNGVGALHFYGFPLTEPRQRDSLSVAAILKANSLGVAVGAVATRNAGGRVIALNLRGKNLTDLPPDIAYLDSLNSLDLGANRLAALPREVAKLPAGIKVELDGNALCQMPGAIAAWADTHAGVGWKNSQSGCGGTGIPARKPGTRSETVRCRIAARGLTLTFPAPGQVTEAAIFTAAGTRMAGFQNPRGEVSIDASGWARGVLFLRFRTVSGSQTIRLPWLP